MNGGAIVAEGALFGLWLLFWGHLFLLWRVWLRHTAVGTALGLVTS